jgi:hypothetical protein
MQLSCKKTTDTEADRVKKIKEAAALQIIAIAPEWKQRNLTAL